MYHKSFSGNSFFISLIFLISNCVTILTTTTIPSPQAEKLRHEYLKTYAFMLAWLAKQQPTSSRLLTARNLVKLS